MAFQLRMILRVTSAVALVGTLIASLGVGIGATSRAEPAQEQEKQEKKEKPEVAFRVNPGLISLPGRVVATIELTKGANDYQDYYCPTIEWEWGDGTRSESVEDCDPYEAGTTQIRRRYSADHRYQPSAVRPGTSSVEITFRMKQGSKTVLQQRRRIRVQGVQ